MKEKNTIEGYMSSDIIGDECSECKSKEDLVVLKVADKIKGLPVEKMYLLCKKCCMKNGIELPKGI